MNTIVNEPILIIEIAVVGLSYNIISHKNNGTIYIIIQPTHIMTIRTQTPSPIPSSFGLQAPPLRYHRQRPRAGDLASSLSINSRRKFRANTNFNSLSATGSRGIGSRHVSSVWAYICCLCVSLWIKRRHRT